MALNSQLRRPPRSLSAELATVLPGALLILLMTGAVVWSLAVSNWAPGLGVLRPVALIALVVGVIFARLPWLPGWMAHLLSAALALTWAVQLLGELMDERLLTWRDQATDIAIRALIWGRVISSGGRGEDILLFVLALCLLVWALAYGTAWLVLRRGWVWGPIILNAAVVLVNYTYVLPKPTLAFFIFLCAALLLLVYQHVLQRQAAWDARQIEYPEFLTVRFLWSSAVVCGALILLTAVLPGQVSVDRATRTWSLISSPFKTAREQWEDLFSTINAPPGAGSGAFTTGTAPLGGARQLSADPVLEVRSTRFDYWRAAAFDRYTGQGWLNTVGEAARAALSVATREQARTSITPLEPIPVGDRLGRREVDQRFTMLEDRLDDLIMVGGTAGRISIPVLIEHNIVATGQGPAPNFDETVAIIAEQRLSAGATYTVTGLMSFADVAGLRAAGANYPAWVRERYLQLPDSTTPRTRDLAARLVAEAGAGTPYDVALTIQNYLRTLPYNEALPSPPGTVDHVDWFLFDQREGYCDYFASAMVVMLRAQGVPARWVRGYAGGEFDAERGVYIVRENIAHSWPEVYFPGYGWERFEPTPASYTTAPSRPLTGQLGEDTGENDPFLPDVGPDPGRFEELDEGLEQLSATTALGSADPPPPAGLGETLSLLAATVGVLALAALAVYGRWRYELRGLSRAGSAYGGMALLAGWSGLRQEAHRTPQEYAATLVAALPEHRRTIERITGAYAREQYGKGGPTSFSPYAGAGLPGREEQQMLYRALVRRIFTTLISRLPQPQQRS